MKKIMVSAGEVSGDVHGQHLIKELKKLAPDNYFFGMGSEKLLSEGVDIKIDVTRRGTIGIFEALPNIIPLFFAYLKMTSLMDSEKPDLLVLIDSQGVNMPLARAAKKRGIKTAYYIAPQEWQWGTPRGVKKVVETIDLIVAIFEKEHEVYQKAGGRVVYFGHPLVDIVSPVSRKSLPGNAGPVIALCPGSRRQEIRSLLPIFLKSAELISREMPEAQFIIPAASLNVIKEIFKLTGDFRPRAIAGQTYEILASSDLAICASGTINLEAALLGTPNIMAYKLSPLTYFLGKYVLKITDRLPYFSLPNLLLNSRVIPELVMADASPNKIAGEAVSLLRDGARLEKMRRSFAELRSRLGRPGVIKNCAAAILQV